jgi:hypothetical protein
MHHIDVYGCTAGATIKLRVIHPNLSPGFVTFPCDASVSTVQAAFGRVGARASPSATSPDPYSGYSISEDNGVSPPTYSVHVNATTVVAPSGITGVAAGTVGTRFTIGYVDPAAIMKNWWEPVVVNTSAASLKAVVSTFQEGGYVNSVAVAVSTPNKPEVLRQVMSLFISTSVPAGQVLTLSWTDSTGSAKSASVTTIVAGGIDSSALVSAINAAASMTTSTLVTSVLASPVSHGSWNEYQIVFALNSATTYFKSSLAVSNLGTTSAFVTTLTNYDNYPWFYDDPIGYGGCGR